MKRIILIFCLSCLIDSICAQDPVSTQYLYSRLEYNPSFAGANGDGVFRFNAFNRSLFHSIKGPFNTAALSVDLGLCNFIVPIGVGVVFRNDIQGDGALMRNDASFVLGYHVSGIPDRKRRKFWNFGFGLETGFISESVNWSKFVFSDQLDPVQGPIYSSSNSSFQVANKVQPNFNFGGQFNKWSGDEDREEWKFHFGFVAANLIEPGIGLINNSPLKRRYSFNAAYILPRRLSKKMGTLIMTARFDNQDIFNTSLLHFEYFINNTLSLGSGAKISSFNPKGIRNVWSWTFMAGIYIGRSFKVVIDPEINFISGGFAITSELALIYIPDIRICKSGSGRPAPKSQSGSCNPF